MWNLLQKMDIWKCFSGLDIMDANGIANTCANAAFNGHLEVLKWARKNGCEWDSDTCARAAQHGNLEVYSSGPDIMDANGIAKHVQSCW